MAEEVVTRNPENFFTQLWSLKNQGLFCDATIVVNGERINVHANVLASSSEYLKNWFAESAIKEITFKDVDKEVLLSLIQYCYTGKIIISEKNACEIFKMAKILSIMTIFDSSSSILEKRLNVSNCLSIWKIAQMGNLQQLQIKAFNFAKYNFEKVSQTVGFLKLKYEEVRDILKSQNVITSEIIAYQIVKRWVDHNEARKSFFGDLLDLINLECLPRNFLISESLTLCGFDAICFKKFNAALQIKENQSIPPCEDYTLIAVGSEYVRTAKKMEIYDVTKKEWIETKEININRSKFSTAIFNNVLLLIGGTTRYKDAVNTVEGYDLRTGQLETLSSMHHARHTLTTVQYKGYIFAIGGGYNNEKYLSNVEMYDPVSDKWTNVAPLNETRLGCSACVFGDKIFVVGGYNGQFLKSVEAYDLSTDKEAYDLSTGKWKKCTPMATGRSGAGVAVIGEYLYVFGGWTNSVERYDRENNNWKTIQSMGTSRGNFGTATFRGKLVIAGGYDSDDGRTVEMYDEETKKWKSMAPFKNIRRYFNLIEIPVNLTKYALSNK